MMIDTQEAIKIVQDIQVKGKGAVVSSYIITCIDTVCEAIIERIKDYEESESHEMSKGIEQRAK